MNEGRSYRGDEDEGGGPYAAQQMGGGAGMGGDDNGSLGLFGGITAMGMQVGMGTIAGFGYGYVHIHNQPFFFLFNIINHFTWFIAVY